MIPSSSSIPSPSPSPSPSPLSSSPSTSSSSSPSTSNHINIPITHMIDTNGTHDENADDDDNEYLLMEFPFLHNEQKELNLIAHWMDQAIQNINHNNNNNNNSDPTTFSPSLSSFPSPPLPPLSFSFLLSSHPQMVLNDKKYDGKVTSTVGSQMFFSVGIPSSSSPSTSLPLISYVGMTNKRMVWKRSREEAEVTPLPSESPSSSSLSETSSIENKNLSDEPLDLSCNDQQSPTKKTKESLMLS